MGGDPIDRGISLPGSGGVAAGIFLRFRFSEMGGLPGHQDQGKGNRWSVVSGQISHGWPTDWRLTAHPLPATDHWQSATDHLLWYWYQCVNAKQTVTSGRLLRCYNRAFSTPKEPEAAMACGPERPLRTA